jgi:hypothetical protein
MEAVEMYGFVTACSWRINFNAFSTRGLSLRMETTQLPMGNF